MMTPKSEAVLTYLKTYYADAKCALHFRNPFECLVAISLSAQTTDKSVNAVTPSLFQDFPTPERMGKAPIEDIEHDIQSLGLYHSKAKNLHALGEALSRDYGGVVPLDFDALKELPGVGQQDRRGVFDGDDRPSRDPRRYPCDEGVHSPGYAKEGDEPLVIEKKLEKIFPESEWIFLHHALIAFGRQECHAKKPACGSCPLKKYCPLFQKEFVDDWQVVVTGAVASLTR
jgi:endonuclease-3